MDKLEKEWFNLVKQLSKFWFTLSRLGAWSNHMRLADAIPGEADTSAGFSLARRGFEMLDLR